MLDRRSEILLSSFVALFSALALFVWIPSDSETGMVETFRRQTNIGDAFLPSIAACGMLIAAVVQLVLSLRRKPAAARPYGVFDGTTAAFFGALVLIVVGSLLLMFWAGPILWEIFGDPERTYRQMRDTAPWKYLGFILGGVSLVWGLTSLIEGRARARRLAAAVLFTGFLILVFDVPFDTLLLPPNGDW
ncbi:hypothetical protein [Oceanibium sediminis]|uniref:hypothetical protein n=1 Tax=Oceanibium sediminis TaxID=2026339 RepID=UPI000DD3DE1C|nr:hypothetical protein [Oceanibium sediminis]